MLALAAEGVANGAPLDEHEVLVLLVQLALLVGGARLLGGIAKRLGQPPVVGELLAGVLAGPTVFGRMAPAAFNWTFGQGGVDSAVFALSWLGVIFLLVVIGFETDLAIIARFRAAAASVSLGAFLVPLAAAVSLAYLVPEGFMGESADRVVFAGMFGLALSVSALPVVAKILQDLGLLRRNFGQITLAAGMTMDTVGWLALAALVGVARDGFRPDLLALSFGGLLLFVAFLVTVGRVVLDRLMRAVMDRGSSVTAALTVALVAALVGGIVTQALHLEAILGAFLMGILLASLRHQIPQVRHTLETVTTSFFAPIFFAYSGLRVDVGLLDATALWWTLGIMAVAVTAKVMGTVVFGRLAGVRGREALALGSGLSALGAMGIVVAIFALNLGVVSVSGYTVMVLVAIGTSVLAPQLLKLVVHGWEIPADEAQRLRREELVASSEILSGRRVLLPTRGGKNSRYAARLVAAVLDDVEVTVMSVEVAGSAWSRILRRSGSATEPTDVVEALTGSTTRSVRRVARDAAHAIAREAQLGYDLVVLGASEEDVDGTGPFSSVVDRVMASVDIPVLVVRFPNGVSSDEEEMPLPVRVLVPVAASRASRAAEELAYSLVRRTGGAAYALHVVIRPDGQGVVLEESVVANAVRAGQEMVTAAAAFGERLGVAVETGVKVAPNPEAEIVEVANRGGFDLVVLGASNRALSDRPYFGHRVAYMIEHAEIPTAIISLPPQTARPRR